MTALSDADGPVHHFIAQSLSRFKGLLEGGATGFARLAPWRGPRQSSGGTDGRTEHPLLLVPREQLRAELDDRVALGEQIRQMEISDLEQLEAARSDFYSWNDYNEELLKRRFTTPEIAEEYTYWGGGVFGGYDSLAQKAEDFRDDVDGKLRKLTSLRDRLGLIDEAATVRRREASPAGAPSAKEGTPESIFIVHGHDGEAKLAVHGFIREVTNVQAVILHEEPNQGRTLIEKFEQVGSGSGFAVAVLTADDEGRAKGVSDVNPRGRQNVVFEFGFFVGLLGRSRTVVLYEEGVESPLRSRRPGLHPLRRPWSMEDAARQGTEGGWSGSRSE